MSDIEVCREIWKSLMSFFHDEGKCVLWLATPNPQFGMTPPATLITAGHAKRLLRAIDDLLEGEHA